MQLNINNLKSKDAIMGVYPNGREYESPQDYYNDKDHDLDIIATLLWRGDRTPQNDNERELKKELDEIKASGKGLELYFD